MDEYRTSLEEKIDNFINSYKSVLHNQCWIVRDKGRQIIFQGNGIDTCKRGDLSILKAVYGLNVDEHSLQWCFRSSSKNTSYSRDIWFKLGDTNKEICTSIKEIMKNISNAVNNINGFDKYMSFSKCIAVPLFKYYRNSDLIISRLNVNSLNINMIVDCFDWCGENDTSWDNYGNEHDRYHQEYLNFPLEMKYLTSKKVMFEKMWEFLDENLSVAYATNDDGSIDYLMDIDNIDFTINGFTIDISNIGRTDFDVYYDKEHLFGYKFKRVASYKKDREVISTEHGFPCFIIKNENIIELIKFVYILRIAGLSNDFDKILEEIINNNYSEIFNLTREEKETLKWFSDYLKDDVLQKEKNTYIEVFNSYGSDGNKKCYPELYWRYWEENGVFELLQRLEKNHFKNIDLLNWMKTKANIN